MCFDKNTIFQIFSCPKKVFQSKYFLLKTQLTTTRGILGVLAKHRLKLLFVVASAKQPAGMRGGIFMMTSAI